MKKNNSDVEIFYHIIPNTKLGDIAVIWKNEKKISVVKIELFGRLYANLIRKYDPSIKKKKCPEICELSNKIQQYLKGKIVRFSLKILDLSPYTDFQKKVWQATVGIQYGRVGTYKEIAKKIGHPQSARAVGQCMANNPFPLVIPCHRVIRGGAKNKTKSGCLLGGMAEVGNYYAGVWIKEALLEMEGSLIHPTSFFQEILSLKEPTLPTKEAKKCKQKK